MIRFPHDVGYIPKVLVEQMPSRLPRFRREIHTCADSTHFLSSKPAPSVVPSNCRQFLVARWCPNSSQRGLQRFFIFFIRAVEIFSWDPMSDILPPDIFQEILSRSNIYAFCQCVNNCFMILAHFFPSRPIAPTVLIQSILKLYRVRISCKAFYGDDMWRRLQVVRIPSDTDTHKSDQILSWLLSNPQKRLSNVRTLDIPLSDSFRLLDSVLTWLNDKLDHLYINYKGEASGRKSWEDKSFLPVLNFSPALQTLVWRYSSYSSICKIACLSPFRGLRRLDLHSIAPLDLWTLTPQHFAAAFQGLEYLSIGWAYGQPRNSGGIQKPWLHALLTTLKPTLKSFNATLPLSPAQDFFSDMFTPIDIDLSAEDWNMLCLDHLGLEISKVRLASRPLCYFAAKQQPAVLLFHEFYELFDLCMKESTIKRKAKAFSHISDLVFESSVWWHAEPTIKDNKARIMVEMFEQASNTRDLAEIAKCSLKWVAAFEKFAVDSNPEWNFVKRCFERDLYVWDALVGERVTLEPFVHQALVLLNDLEWCSRIGFRINARDFAADPWILSRIEDPTVLLAALKHPTFDVGQKGIWSGHSLLRALMQTRIEHSEAMQEVLLGTLQLYEGTEARSELFSALQCEAAFSNLVCNAEILLKYVRLLGSDWRVVWTDTELIRNMLRFSSVDTATFLVRAYSKVHINDDGRAPEEVITCISMSLLREWMLLKRDKQDRSQEVVKIVSIVDSISSNRGWFLELVGFVNSVSEQCPLLTASGTLPTGHLGEF
jgi:hypothetical protein